MKTNLKTTLIKIAGALCAVACISSAHATLNAYDSFNYSSITTGTAAPTGTPTQTTGGGFTGNWSAANSTTTGLTYTSLPTANNAVSAGNNAFVTLASPISSGTIYFSFLFRQPTGVNTGNNGGHVDRLEFLNSRCTLTPVWRFL